MLAQDRGLDQSENRGTRTKPKQKGVTKGMSPSRKAGKSSERDGGANMLIQQEADVAENNNALGAPAK